MPSRSGAEHLRARCSSPPPECLAPTPLSWSGIWLAGSGYPMPCAAPTPSLAPSGQHRRSQHPRHRLLTGLLGSAAALTLSRCPRLAAGDRAVSDTGPHRRDRPTAAVLRGATFIACRTTAVRLLLNGGRLSKPSSRSAR